jgi:hypothetical protein
MGDYRHDSTCFYVPETHIDIVKDAVFAAGAGQIGNYEHCAWQVLGQGQFREIDVITVYRQILGAVLVIFTIQSQRLLTRDASRAELEVAIREVEDLILRFVQPA